MSGRHSAAFIEIENVGPSLEWAATRAPRVHFRSRGVKRTSRFERFMSAFGTSTSVPALLAASDLSSKSDCDDVSTCRTAQKYSRETPKQSSTLQLPNSAIRVRSLMRAGQTFQQATQVQTLRLCPSQGWPKHRPDKLVNTQQNPAFTQLNIHWWTQAWAAGDAIE